MSIDEKISLLAKVDAALDYVRPHLAVDGGDVEVVDITPGGIVQVKWLGNCHNCSMSYMTMKAGLEQTLLGRVPEVSGVEAVE